MKPYALLLFSLISVTFVPIPSRAQWGPGGCRPVGPFFQPLMVAPQHAYVPSSDIDGWYRGTDRTGATCYYYLRNNKVVGGYCPVSLLYRTYDGTTWSASSIRIPRGLPAYDHLSPVANKPAATPRPTATVEPEPKVEPKPEPKVEPVSKDEVADSTELPTGVVKSELGKHGTRYLISEKGVTREVDRDKAIERLEPYVRTGGELTDDSKKPRLTLIGPKADRERALAELPAELKTKWLVQSYEPTDWAIKNYGFVTTGTPTIYLQEPSGKVMFRQDAYEGPKTWDAVRKADPTYDPNKDPNGKPSPLIPTSGSVPTWVWIVGGAALLYWLFKGQKTS